MFILQWWRRRWGWVQPTVSVKPPSPTRLRYTLVAHELALSGDVDTRLAFEPQGTTLGFLGDDGFPMSTPLVFTAGETGPMTLTMSGADGTHPDLTSASSVTFTLQNIQTGTVKVDAVALTSLTSDGTGVWTRTSTQVDTAGDYLGQAKVVNADATVTFYPDAQGNGQFSGSAITLLKALGG